MGWEFSISNDDTSSESSAHSCIIADRFPVALLISRGSNDSSPPDIPCIASTELAGDCKLSPNALFN